MYKQFKYYFDTIQECDHILATENDKELVSMAKEELLQVLEDIEDTQEKACEELVPISELDEKDCTIEIKHAAGGTESALFAEVLKGMYENY